MCAYETCNVIGSLSNHHEEGAIGEISSAFGFPIRRKAFISPAGKVAKQIWKKDYWANDEQNDSEDELQGDRKIGDQENWKSGSSLFFRFFVDAYCRWINPIFFIGISTNSLPQNNLIISTNTISSIFLALIVISVFEALPCFLRLKSKHIWGISSKNDGFSEYYCAKYNLSYLKAISY